MHNIVCTVLNYTRLLSGASTGKIGQEAKKRTQDNPSLNRFYYLNKLSEAQKLKPFRSHMQAFENSLQWNYHPVHTVCLREFVLATEVQREMK